VPGKDFTREQVVPIYFTNPDIVFAHKFPWPRLAQASFRIALEGIYKTITGNDLKYQEMGKPTKTTFHVLKTSFFAFNFVL